MSTIQTYIPEEKPAKFDFQLFLKQLKSKKADPVIRYIRSFLTKFNQKLWTAQEQEKLINDFKDFIIERMTEFEPFSLMNKNDFENSISGVEKLIMTKIYEQTFSPEIPSSVIDDSHRSDLEIDEVLQSNYKDFSHLGIKDFEVDEAIAARGDKFINLAGEELNKMDQFKSPRAKIICILNSCKILFQLIKRSDQTQNADEFLPLLIYTVHKTAPIHLYSNLMFIERFAFTRTSEVQYYIVSLNAVVEYIKNLSSDSSSADE
ncbi:Vacuolar protein sorting-associated protein [Wickerhamomyces ciferrii]|uniref:Vacuolar protein sorting-associated protein n=1 Tax=Wickerhamomyces ciferrii (strain ATCC 14091 / BCRC 22168 / CBS 111 / JCM 3599 / NBRC 0793 / NRRL Y-1031 F-60-10) TaxID=1206466 RepID=K0KVB0_WICCF|nr:Vacuolar protein sorting-associated protein [Wickerhamomyces ciferrii]CCH45374.1 Vacuolar protein sorting-associated protein [Wickerhamomyces ciferrii]